MLITENTKIEDIKLEFSSRYPGLKLNFYKKHHDVAKGSAASDEIVENYKIGDASSSLVGQHLSMDEDLDVGSFELKFEEQLNLHVQVMRKSGDLWLQTINTDSWSLAHQNEIGLRSRK